MTPPRVIFLTKVRTTAGKAAARLLIESLQTFGGELRGCPIWVFATDPQQEACRDLASAQVEVFPLAVPETLKYYLFGDKVYACARAEQQAPRETQSLIWLDLDCLVVQPPRLYHLEDDFDAALRPVHVRNVGLAPDEALDAFWKGIYTELDITDVPITVESFVDRQRLRAYFNSHGLSLRPSLGLFNRWLGHFERLVGDRAFQQAACPDEPHRIFLFQALLSALVAASVESPRLRILPPAYNYPYNLQSRVPQDQRATVLNDLVSLTFEGRSLAPAQVTDITIQEPLRTWLQSRAAAGQE
jgi:hypothetical protein